MQLLCNATIHRGIIPTIRELQEELGFSSSRGVVGHLIALERKGYIRRDGGARGIRVIKFEQRNNKPKCNARYLPLVGQVAAGVPIFAEENIQEWVPVPSAMAHCDRSFLLRARGDSMIGAHILDGDLLVVCPEGPPRQNDIVVALIDDEATVKRFHKKNGCIELKAENPKYAPMRLGSDRQITIQGKVVGVLRTGGRS